MYHNDNKIKKLMKKQAIAEEQKWKVTLQALLPWLKTCPGEEGQQGIREQKRGRTSHSVNKEQVWGWDYRSK